MRVEGKQNALFPLGPVIKCLMFDLNCKTCEFTNIVFEKFCPRLWLILFVWTTTVHIPPIFSAGLSRLLRFDGAVAILVCKSERDLGRVSELSRGAEWGLVE